MENVDEKERVDPGDGRTFVTDIEKIKDSYHIEPDNMIMLINQIKTEKLPKPSKAPKTIVEDEFHSVKSEYFKEIMNFSLQKKLQKLLNKKLNKARKDLDEKRQRGAADSDDEERVKVIERQSKLVAQGNLCIDYNYEDSSSSQSEDSDGEKKESTRQHVKSQLFSKKNKDAMKEEMNDHAPFNPNR